MNVILAEEITLSLFRDVYPRELIPSLPSSPGGDFICLLPSRGALGEIVEVLKPGPRWTQVKYGARTGYMMTEFLAAGVSCPS